MLGKYAIAPLRPEHRAGIVRRLRNLYPDGVFSDMRFSRYLVQEGNSPFYNKEAE